MNIKFTFCIFLFVIFSIPKSSLAQNDKKEIRSTFNEYFEIVGKMETEKTMDYIYPRLFEHVPKEMMIAAMDNFKSDTTINITMKDFEIQEISNTIEVDGVKYALVDYTFTMIMVLKQKADEDMNPTQFTADILKMQYGEDNIKTDLEKNQIDIHVPAALYTIHDPKYDGWKFLERKENLMPILKQILPEEVIKEL